MQKNRRIYLLHKYFCLCLFSLLGFLPSFPIFFSVPLFRFEIIEMFKCSKLAFANGLNLTKERQVRVPSYLLSAFYFGLLLRCFYLFRFIYLLCDVHKQFGMDNLAIRCLRSRKKNRTKNER